MVQSFLYIPEGLPPEDIMPQSLKKYAEDACYFIHKIYEQRVLNIRHRDGFVPLKSQYLRKVMSERRYKDIRESLLAGNVVETDGRYIKGEKCMGYRLGSNWSERPHKKIYLTNKRLISNIEEVRVKNEDRLTNEHRHLLYHLKSVKIDDGAEAFLHKDLSKDQLRANITAINMIRDGLWNLTSDVYGRVHTNLTNLNSCLRRCLRVREKRLVELDIKNSQPMFFGLILISYFTNNNKLVSYNLSNPLPLLPPLRCDILPPDARHYVELVRDGVLYEHLSDKWGINPDEVREFKTKLFSEVFFCPNKWVTKRTKLFSQEFPSVYQVITKMKDKDYKRLATHLQKIESSFIINKVARTFMDSLPEEFIATIHDSLLIFKENEDIIRDIIDIEFRPWGIVPSLRVKEF